MSLIIIRSFVEAMAMAWEREGEPRRQSDGTNSSIAYGAIGRRPICQTREPLIFFIEIGHRARLDLSRPLQRLLTTQSAVPTRLTPTHCAPCRGGPFDAKTPATIHPEWHVELVEGDKVSVHVSAKGGGSENKAKFTVLNPSGSVADWVVQKIETLGAGWCPPNF